MSGGGTRYHDRPREGEMRSHIVCCLGIVAVGSLALAPVAWAQSDIVPPYTERAAGSVGNL